MKRRVNWNLLIGGGILILIVLMAMISLFYTPFLVDEMHVEDRFQSPNTTYLLGTDHFGRDILSRTMVGAQTALYVALFSVVIGGVLGTFIGALAGYLGKWWDEILMRWMDAVFAFPALLMAIMFVAVLGGGITTTMLAIAIVNIPVFARIARSGFLQVRQYDFVAASKTLGASSGRIMFRHILPNVLSPLLVQAAVSMGAAVLAEASLSYLGLGIQPPDPSWGIMLKEAQSHLLRAPWFSLAPGTMILLLVISLHMLADGLRDHFDPHQR
ncbi:ABC transporter permease [Rubeoparvulum massiliense]|uniref:ABC transporter permease n=1 Tax=Rubeoparvulum massiliense TaxID=1631346 RepID=UPI00065DC7F9|nr:ABC transporter permease [Rubeoparvulum massiliense]